MSTSFQVIIEALQQVYMELQRNSHNIYTHLYIPKSRGCDAVAKKSASAAGCQASSRVNKAFVEFSLWLSCRPCRRPLYISQDYKLSKGHMYSWVFVKQCNFQENLRQQQQPQHEQFVSQFLFTTS